MRAPLARATALGVLATWIGVGSCVPVRPLAAHGLSSGDEQLAVVGADSFVPLHTQLEASVPADGDTLTQPPASIRLEFNRAVDASLGELRLFAADGRLVTLAAGRDSADDRVLVATPPTLPSGSYRVVWRIVADDGHPVTGEFSFVVALPSPPAAAAGSSTAPGEWQPAGAESSRTEPSRTVVATLRALAAGSLLALAGVLAFVAWWVPAPSPGARRLAAVLAILAPIFLLAHSVAWLGYIAPPDRGVDLGLAGAALDTATGRVEIFRLVAALLAAFALLRLRRVGLAAGLALLAVLSSGGTGHAADGPLYVAAAKSAHLVAGAVWVGGLLLLVTSRPGASSFPTLASRVSGLALASVILIAVSGAWQTIDLVPSFGDLFGSGYGRMVLAKLGGFVVLIGFGARHRVHLMPRLAGSDTAGTEHDSEGDRESAARHLRRSVSLELLVMVVVLVLAGLLAYLPLPDSAAG